MATLSGVGDTHHSRCGLSSFSVKLPPPAEPAHLSEGQAPSTFTPVPVKNDTLSLLTGRVCFMLLIFRNKATPAQRNFLFRIASLSHGERQPGI